MSEERIAAALARLESVLADENGARVSAAFSVARLQVLVERANQRSPVAGALQQAVPLELSIELQD
jgi:hypothetical protein